MRGLKVWIGGVMLSMLVGCMVAGRDADIADWPGMASLQSVSGKNVYHECGATVIAPDWALTAAHCVENVRIETSGRAAQYITDEAGRLARAGTLALGVGLADLSEIPPAAVHAITQVRLHPDYQTGAPELGNDIALLKLERSWQGELMPLAGLTAPEQDVYAPYAEVLAAGYGKKGEAARDEQAIVRGARHVLAPSLILQEGYVPPVEPQLCHRQIKAKLESLGLGDAYRDVRIEAATQICAGIGHSDACQGDSGGPLIQRAGMSNPVQVGVVSWGIGCGRLETPGIYMRASAYAGWISEITGQALSLPVEEVAAGLAPVEETTGNLAEMLEETGSPEKSADDP